MYCVIQPTGYSPLTTSEHLTHRSQEESASRVRTHSIESTVHNMLELLAKIHLLQETANRRHPEKARVQTTPLTADPRGREGLNTA